MRLSKYKTSTLMTLLSLSLFLIVTVMLIFIINHFFRKEAIHEAKDKAELILDKNLSVHDYYTHQLKPVLFESLKDTIAKGKCFEHVWMSSSYVIKIMDMYFQKRNSFGYFYKDATISARNPDNEADSLEIAYLNLPCHGAMIKTGI